MSYIAKNDYTRYNGQKVSVRTPYGTTNQEDLGTVSYPADWMMPFATYVDGEVVYNWRGKIRQILDATGNYSLKRSQVRSAHFAKLKGWNTNANVTGYTYTDTVTRIPYLWYYDPFANSGLSSPFDVDAKALLKLHDKLRALKGRIETPSFLGEQFERKKILEEHNISMARQAAIQSKKEAGVYRKHRYVRRNPYKVFLNTVAQMRLQWAFDISPTVTSIIDARDALKKAYETTFTQVRTSSRSFAMKSKVPSYIDLGNSTTAYETASLSLSTGRTYILLVKPSDPFKGPTAFDNDAIGSMIWELTPWSWLVDYFFDVGNWLGQEQNCAWEIAWGNTTSFKRYEQIVRWLPAMRPMTPNLRAMQAYHGGLSHTWHTSLARTKIKAIPYYVPQLKFAGALSTPRLLNLASVIVTKFLPY